MGEQLLSLTGISKGFPGVQALSDVSFSLAAGEVHALMGENGAGKSTLIKILCGVQPPDSGQILIDGKPVTVGSPVEARALGIAPVHQELHLEPYLSVAENIFLGCQPRTRFGTIDWKGMVAAARGILDELGVGLDATAEVGRLSIAERQVVAIARAVSTRARIMIFDEPTSSLTRRETELLLSLIRRLRGQGIGIVYVSHRMEEIFDLCDRVTVFRDGRYVSTGRVAETSLDQLIRAIVGRDIVALPMKATAIPGKTLLDVCGLSKKGLLHDISFSLRSGEIVGLSGLVGSGRTELARTIFGDITPDSGEILVDGTPVARGGPRAAIAAGIGLVPEDRKDQGLVVDLSVMANVGMPSLGVLGRFGVLSRRRERRLAEDYVKRLAIRTPTVGQKAMFLSGGNQQRVVIAKWLATRPKVLIVDEPTRGVDVGAKSEIHALLRSLASEGMAILMISSDLPEVLAVSDRILVMNNGRISGELSGDAVTQEQVMGHAMGVA
ncbi:sugar ABC transporter ATP-binding protein [Mesorhizobium sp. PUT5]|uniref:sugar ABC transporter ATP-binding protein n=1 Tax=Mesorhizobium sp. PUT5 TaxID=3454629 RepID=UPI003FA40713